jgi:hypothetical protein
MKSSTRIIVAAGTALIAGAITMSVAWSAPRASSPESAAAARAQWQVQVPASALAGRALEAPSGPISCPALESSKIPGCLSGYVLVGTDGRPQGVTATGQASIKGKGTQVRDQAIQQAVADARDQAQAAAQAAGVTLGSVIDIQVSAPGYPYPVLEGNAASSGIAPPSVIGSGGGAPPTTPSCPSTAVCVAPSPVPVAPPIAEPLETFVSVTVTWSIAG